MHRRHELYLTYLNAKRLIRFPEDGCFAHNGLWVGPDTTGKVVGPRRQGRRRHDYNKSSG
jgi:hypothetical protein